MLSLHIHSLGALALAISTLTGNAQALYDAASKTNLAMYWGQGPGQLDLIHYCQQPSVDIIPIGFIHVFPENGNGYPGSNFGNQCGPGVYPGPGPNPANDQLLSNCPGINRDIPVCQQTYGKKIVLSLGGATPHTLMGDQAGRDFADFLWGAYGPRTAEWVDAGKPRPFDGENGEEVQVDGFDMDIEFPNNDNSAGYIALLRRLRELFATASKPYIITGAPQCVVPDANMAQMIAAVPFDIIFVQFYNTGFCSARDYIERGVNSQFSYDQWSDFLVGTASANAKLYIGLPGSPEAAGGGGIYWLNPSEAATLIEDFYDRDNFGGVMLWEATRAEGQIDNGMTYYDNIKLILAEAGSIATSSISTTATATLSTTVSTVVSTESSTVSTTTNTLSSLTSSSTSGTPSETATSSSSVSASSSLSSTATSATLTTSLPTTSTSISETATSSSSVSASNSLSSTATSATSSSSVSASDSLSSTATSATLTTSLPTTSTSISTSTLPPSSSSASSAPSSLSTSLPPSSSSSTPSSTHTSTSSPSPTGLRPSQDGSCGNGVTCGNRCCSRFGWCGDSPAHCDSGCRPLFGTCPGLPSTMLPAPSSTVASVSVAPSATSSRPQPSLPPYQFPISQDGACGAGAGKACAGNTCCSVWGWCGVGELYCGVNYCQTGFGTC